MPRVKIARMNAHQSFESPAADEVVVRVGARGYTARVSAAGHEIVADEPVSLGGGGAGPSPYDLLLAALGSCIAMTARMYADRKGWALESVTVRLRHGRVHAADCAECETREGKIDQIERRVEFEGALSAEQRARLLDIAGKCPVHRTLTSEIRIVEMGAA